MATREQVHNLVQRYSETRRKEQEKQASARSTGTTSARQARREEEDEELGGLLGGLMRVMQRNTEINNSRAYRTEEIRREADRELGQAVANAITPDDPVKALGRAQRSTGLRTVPAERREEIVRESLREDGHTDEEIDAAKTRTPEVLYNEYNQWLEEGDNRQRLNDLVQSEQAARKESDIDERMHKLGYTDAEIEEIRTRRQEYEQSVPFGYDIGHRIASSAAGIGSQAVGSALMGLPVMAQGLEDFLLHDYDTRPEDIDGLAGSMYQLGRQIYDQGDESLGEARLGLSDMQDVAYSLGEMAGENVGMAAIFGPQALLIEQSLRALCGGVADMADEGRGAESAALSGLAHGAVSYGIEQLGIAQMMRNMGRASGLNRVTDSIVDRIASLPGIAQLGQGAPWLAGTLSSAGEEATEEFVQTYADTAVDALLGRETPGLLSGELLNEAAQSAVMGAAGGGLIGGISSGIGAVQDVRQGRIAPRADLVANANLSATIEQAGQIGRAQQAAAGTAQAQQEQQAAAQVQQAALEAAAETETTTPPNEGGLLDALADILPDGEAEGGRLDAAAWERLRGQGEQFAGAGNMVQAAGETSTAMRPTPAADPETLTAQDQRRAVRQNWTDEQRAEAMLLEANTSMTEAAVNTAVEAMPADVSGDVYSVAANTVYQLSRQGIAEDWDAALDLASRSGVRVNQILAAPGGAEALQMIYNRGQMDGIEAAGYSAAGLADERQAGQVQYQPGALVPEEDKMLFDLYAAAGDTAVTVSDRLEKNAGGYVDTALGKVYFGAEADADTFGTILHESVHQYNAWDEAGGRELQTATLRYLAEQQGFESVNDLVESYIQRYQEAGQELSYAQACEEITADAMRGVFGSEEAFARWVEHQRALAEQNGRQRSTIAKVMDRVREVLDKVISKAKSILSREPGNAAARQAQALAESQKRALEELYYKHAETAMEAQRTARRSQNQTENVNESEESANENQTDVASSQQNVASEGENVASERRYQLPVESDEERASRRLANLSAELDDLNRQRRALREEREAWEKSENVQKLNAEKEAARKHGLFSAEYKAFQQTPQYQSWVENRKALNARATELEKRMGEVQDRVREVYGQLKAIRSAKNNDARASYDEAAERNGGKATYRRTLAVERFGTTEQFERAGYILPDGQMLDFAQNDSTRDTDHREIIDVFGPSEVKTGTEALNAFLADGNIRVMAEAPDIDVSTEVRPSAEQLERIREMAETIGAERRGFTLDFSAADGKAVASKTYRGRINADRIVREIREYYQTGTLPEESNLAQFRYQLPVDEGRMESGQRAAAVENMDVAGLADYLSELYSNGEVRRVPVENVQRLARKFIREYGSKANETTIAKQIDGLLNYMATGQADYRIVRQVAEGIADTILRSSTRRDYTLWNQYKDLHYFTVKVERGGMEQRELISKYGSYEIAKKELAKFGIKVTTGTKDNPRHIDQVYQELSNDYPGWFRSDVTDPMAQLDRIAEVRHSIQPIIVNNFAESYDETVADVTVQLIGAAVGEGVTDTGIAGMLRQRIDENLNAHRAGIQQRVQDALNEQARTARNESFRQAQRIVKTAGEANQQRMERERKEWAETSNEMRRALARSKGVAQRARDAREADVVRRQIATARTKLTRMLLHPNDQYHVPPQWIQTAIDIAELANHYTYNNQAVKKLQALRTQLEDLAKTDDGVDGISSDWENSGIKEMLESLTTGMERVSSTRLQKQADAQARRMQSGQQVLDAQREAVENMGLGDRKLFNFTLDELRTLRDATRAMVTLIQNSNKLVATQTAQSAAEFASVATQEVATSKYRLGDRRNVFKSLLNNWRANFNNAERMLMVMGGYRHGGAMETLSKSLSEGEAKKTSIREKGLQLFENVLKGKENEKKLRKFSGVDAELIDIGLVFDGDGKAAKINRAQAAGVYLHLQNEQNRNHLLKGGVVIPDMNAYIKGDIKNAYRLTRTAHIKDAGQTLGVLEKMLEEDEYFRQWVDDAKEFFNVYTRNIINETSRRLNGYDKATVENYYPLTVDPDVLQQEIEGLVHNGTIEGRGFLKPRQQRAAQPILLEELDRVMVRSLADTAAYGGLAPAIRDANKILNANRTEGGSLWKVIGTAFGDEGKKFMKDYLTDLQQQPRGRKSIYDFLGGLRGNYAGAVLTLNLATAAGQISGVPAAASELGADATWEAFKFMKKQKAETLEALRKEMTDHGYWQLESTLSTGATAELAELRQKRGLVKAVSERVPGVNLLEHMDMKTRLALWVGSKYYVDHNLEEFGLTEADIRGEHRSEAWWDAVVAKMTQANDRTQPNYTVSQQAAIQRNPDQLVKTLVMFKSQSFQNFQIVTSAIEDYFAQKDYVEEAAKKLADTSLDAEGRQQAQADLERAQAERQTAGVRLKRALASQAVSSAVYVAVTLLIKDVLLHRYDRDKDKNGQITPASVAGRFGWEFVSNLMENIPFVDIGINILSGDDDPIDLSGIDSIGDAVSDLKQIVSDIMNEDRTSEDEEDRANYWSNLKEQAFDTVTSLLNLAGVPFGQVQRWVEGINGWINDFSTAANSDGLILWDVMNAPPSSASQYDRLYTAVFEEPDPEDAAAALKRLADLDELTPPAKASDAKAGDSKLLTELLKREREYGTSVQDAAAARVAGDEDQQRQIRQELVNTLADALGIDQSTKEGQRRLRTVINKVDSAITDEVREQMGADSKTGATVYTPLLTALEDGGDLTAAQTVLRRAGITDSDIKSAVQSVYKDEYLWADDARRQEIETKLLRLKDAYGEPYFTKTKDQDDFADWVTDWTLQGLNDSVYTDLDEALLTEDRAAAQQEINRYMEAGKEIGSIRNRVSSLYKREYQNADAARRRELGRFLAGLVAGGEQVVTTDTLLDWIKESYR